MALVKEFLFPDFTEMRMKVFIMRNLVAALIEIIFKKLSLTVNGFFAKYIEQKDSWR